MFFFSEVFCIENLLSKKVVSLFNEALYGYESQVRIIVPSIVFVEIFEKWSKSYEFLRKFYYEVFTPIYNSPNFEIRSIDFDTLIELQNIRGSFSRHDLHDKLILASALSLRSTLITSDSAIYDFVNQNKLDIRIIYNSN